MCGVGLFWEGPDVVGEQDVVRWRVFYQVACVLPWIGKFVLAMSSGRWTGCLVS